MTVVQQSSTDRTFVDAVTRIITMIGESEIATLLNPTRRISIAMRCVQDARDEVYYRTLWEFRRAFYRLELATSTMWYALPDDYHKMASGLSRNTAGEGGLKFITYDQLISNWPDLRSYPPGSGVSDISTVLQLAGQTLTFGDPKYYVITDQYVGLYPIPDSDFVELEGQLYAAYWKQAGVLRADNDSLNLPQQLWSACHYLALAQLKKALEFSDWEADYAIGSRQLSRESSSKREPEDDTVYHEAIANYNE